MYFYEQDEEKDSATVVKITDMDADFTNISFGEIEYKMPSYKIKKEKDKNYFVLNSEGLYIHLNGGILHLHFYINNEYTQDSNYFPIRKEKIEYREGEYYLI